MTTSGYPTRLDGDIFRAHFAMLMMELDVCQLLGMRIEEWLGCPQRGGAPRRRTWLMSNPDS